MAIGCRRGIAWITMQAADSIVVDAVARRGQAGDLAGTGLLGPWGTQFRFVTVRH